VKQKKEMNTGTKAQFTPFEFIKDGKIVGYSTDLLALIMADLPGVRANRQDVPFQAILPGLSAKKFDFVVTSVTVTNVVEVAPPYDPSGNTALLRATLMYEALCLLAESYRG
jgi:ABC-type amino acid transport substrate-binding protein